MNEQIAWKISQGAHLDPAELQELVAFINRTEGTNAKVGVMATGQGEVTQLSDITPQAGRIYGEFISPKSPEMFDPLSATFTGVVMVANGLTIGGATYNLLGIKAGVVQWGANTADASFQAGAEAVTLDADGITIIGGVLDSNSITYISNLNSRRMFRLYTIDTTFGPIGGYLTSIKSNEDSDAVHSNIEMISESPSGKLAGIDLQITEGGAIKSQIVMDKNAIYINNGSENIDTIIKGDTDANLIRADASTDRVGIGTATPDYKLDVNGTLNATALRGAHAHNGSDGTSKLAQANTHESPDTDTGATSLHHTLGTGANQAAAGNHAHATYAATTHAHTGADGTSKLAQANTHESADTDTATTALHHTLGTDANQAAAGNHSHTAFASGLDISGGATTINSGGGDYDTTIKGDNRDVAVVDASRDTLLVSKLNLVGGGTLTISGGVVTATHSRHVIAPESGTADDLDTINGYADGDVLILGTTTGNTITLKDETGNLALEGDFVMNAVRDTITLVYRDNPGRWCELARSNNA